VSDSRPGRNDACHCGSGRKYKQCHLDKDEAAARAARAKALAEAPAEAAAEPVPATPARAAHSTRQPWKRGTAINTQGFQRMSAPRKVGSS
jgi:hypothetical protein